MDLLSSAILGLVQGLTEFLPVSSTAHLILVPRLFRLPQPTVAFAVLLHLGTALAVITFFWREFWAVLAAFGRSLAAKARGQTWKNIFESDPNALLAWGILWAMVPTAVIGFSLKDFFEQGIFNQPAAVGALLLVTGLILFWGSQEEPTAGLIAATARPRKDKAGFLDAFIIGLAQGIAVAPGISRSGTTVVAALKRRLDRTLAIRFSFLLSLPAILGAGLVEAKDILAAPAGDQSAGALALGFIIAWASGWWSIKYFVRLIKANRFRFFAYYCWVVGAVTILISLMAPRGL